MSRRILVRCDAGSRVGLGHLMRCIGLAEALKRMGCHVEYLVAHDFAAGFPIEIEGIVHTLPLDMDAADDIAEIDRCAKTIDADAIVLDTYRADHAYQLKLAGLGIPWLQFDCNAKTDPLLAQWVVCPLPGIEPQDYASRLIAHSRLLLGPSYAVLRPDIREMSSSQPHIESQTCEIALAFGGGDDEGALLLALEAITTAMPEAVIRVFTTSANPRLERCQQWIDRHPYKIELIVDAADYLRLFSRSTFAVIAGGMTLIESAALGIPVVVVVLADNQLNNAAAWQKLGTCWVAGRNGAVSTDDLGHRVKLLAEDSQKRAAMSHAGRSIVDGSGAERVAAVLLEG